MVKTSLLLMVVLTVLASMGLRWREKRTPVAAPRGWVATQKRNANRWVTAAAIAVVATLALLGGLQWLRVWLG